MQLNTGQFRRDVAQSKADIISLGATVRERKNDFTQVEAAARSQARATKEAAAEARKAAQDQAAAARVAREAAQEAVKNAREMAAAAKSASPEMKKAAEEQAAAARQTAKELKEAAREQAELAKQARATSRERSAVAKEAQQIATQAKKAAQEQAQAHKQAEKAAQEYQQSLTAMGAVGVTVTTAIALGLAAIVREAAVVEHALASLKAVSGATSEEMRKATDAANKFGPEFGTMPDQAVKTLEEFSKAGVEFTRLAKGELKDALALVSAGELEVGEAAAIAAIGFSVYKDENLKLKQIGDAVVGAANASSTSVREMGDAFRQIGGVAHDVGYSFSDVNTEFALMAKNGLRGSDGATSMKTAILQLVNPTDEAKRVMKDLGLEFFDSTGRMKSFSDIAAMLQDKLGGFNKKSQEMIMSVIGGSDAVRFFSTLMKQTTQDWQDMQGQMSKVSAEEVAQGRLDSLIGSFQKLRAEGSVAAQGFASSLTPVIQALTDDLAGLVEEYNGLSAAEKGLITGAAVTAGAMSATATAASLGALAFSKLAKAIQLAGGAAAILTKHPIILSLTLAAGIITSVVFALKQHEEAAREAAAAQAEYNQKLSDAATTKDVGRYNELREEARRIDELGKKYEDLHEKRKSLEDLQSSQKDTGLQDGVDYRDHGKTREELKKLDAELAVHIEKMGEAGISVENYKDRLDGLQDALAKNARTLLEANKADVDRLAGIQDNINKIQEAAKVYEQLSTVESLNSAQKTEMAGAVKTLTSLVPGLNAQQLQSGKITLTNTSLIYDKVRALQSEKKQSQDTTISEINSARVEAEARLTSYTRQIEAIRALAAARNALVQGGEDKVLPDNFAYRERTHLDSLDDGLAVAKTDLAEIDAALDKIKSGTPYTPIDVGGGGGGSDYKIPDPPKKDKADEEDRKMREAYNKRLEQERQLLDTGVINRMVYVQRLQAIEAEFSGWLANNESERNQIRNDQWSEHFRYSTEWIEDRKRQMQDAGMSDQQVAEEEIKAWERVLSRTNLMAEDRKRAEEDLRRARMDARGADMEHSIRWIEEEKERMQDAGASEVEIAQMVYDAWKRVDSRKGTGRYNLEDEKRAADELKSAYQSLAEVVETDLRRARELDRDFAIKAAEEEIKLAEEVMQARHKGEIKAIQDKIDALDEQAKAEDRILQYQREQERLAELKDQRNKVADDKRFEIIEADENGVLAPKLVADPNRLAELDEDIKEQQAKLGEMRREDERNRRRKELEEDMEETRERHEKEAKELQKSNEEKMAAMRSFWEGQLREEKLTSDLRNAIVKDGLEATKSNVETYLKGMVDSYAQAQAEIQALGGLIGSSESSGLIPSTKPSAGSPAPSGGSSTGTGSYDYHKDTRVYRNGQYVGDPSMTPEEYSKKLPKAHTGLKRVPGAPGQESDYKLIAGERVLSAAQNDGLDAFLRRAATWTSPAEAIMRTMTYQPPAPTPSRPAQLGGQSVSIDTGGAPLIAIYPPQGMDVKALGDEVDRRVDRRFAEIGFKMGNRK